MGNKAKPQKMLYFRNWFVLFLTGGGFFFLPLNEKGLFFAITKKGGCSSWQANFYLVHLLEMFILCS